MNFEVNTSNYLGYDYQSWQRKQYANALKDPSKYAQMREDVISSMRNDAVRDVYQTISLALTKGLSKQNQFLCDPPCYPDQLVAELALEGSQTMERIMQKCVDIIIPRDYQDLANNRLHEQSKA